MSPRSDPLGQLDFLLGGEQIGLADRPQVEAEQIGGVGTGFARRDGGAVGYDRDLLRFDRAEPSSPPVPSSTGDPFRS